MSDSNDNDWETYYSDENDYVENMKSLHIGNNNIKKKRTKFLEEQNKNISTHQSLEHYVSDEYSLDESSVTSYSIDNSMLSDMNDLSFLTTGQNLATLLNNASCENILEDDINNDINQEVLTNIDTSSIAKKFFNSNETTDLSDLLPSSINGSTSVLSTENDTTNITTKNNEVTEVATENSDITKIVPENNDETNVNLSEILKVSEPIGETSNEDDDSPMFINRVSSIPIVQQSVQAIKSTSIGNFAGRTLKRVASTRLPVISVPRLPSIVSKNKENEDKKENKEPSGITIEDATKSIPGLSTINTIGCKTLDKLEENFPMIKDPELLNKIINRIEELREIGENTAVVQSSINSLQNMQNRISHFNSVIVKRNKNDNQNNSSLKHSHSFSTETTKVEETTTNIKNNRFTSTIRTTTTLTAKTSIETHNTDCYYCRQHHKKNQQESSKARFFLRHSQKLSAFKEINFIRSNLQNNINAIPNVMYSRLSNVLTNIEKKLLSGTELEKEIIANTELKKNQENIKEKTLIANCNNNILKDNNRFFADPSSISLSNSSLQTTTSTSTMDTNINHQNSIQSLSPTQITSSDSHIDSLSNKPSTVLSTVPGTYNAPVAIKSTMKVKNEGLSHVKISINNDGAHVHDLYSFLEEVNKLLTIYLVTRKKKDQTEISCSTNKL